MKNEDLKKNIKSGHIWLRLVYMILFAFVLQVAVAVLWVVVIIQFLFKLLSGKANFKLAQFADSLVKYITQSFEFECFISEEKPFPFMDFPESDIEPEPEPEPEIESESSDELESESEEAAVEAEVEAEVETPAESNSTSEDADESDAEDKKA